VAAGAETQHELEGAMEERERMVEEARMLRLHLKAAGAKNTQLEAEVNKLVSSRGLTAGRASVWGGGVRRGGGGLSASLPLCTRV